eukprot:GHVN01067910.1.p2 GENE.GHVN01067910.1~~GHVN01067910.1.p2  ORF type:complete len:1133 (+),score=173.55 GHVN01067910.1:946-4344(+)
MHIREIRISGFKSYRDEVLMEGLSRGHNVVVGRNGTGKSSLFAAIRFVLGDAYTRLDEEERKALIYEDNGVGPMSSFVEIVFDNVDGRFPTGRETVVLRRTIGMKKDEYTLDGRSIVKGDVMSLLQSAGFSKANPYYIVPQGRVTSLTNSKEHERLQLLKEIAGTRIYEEHREESARILGETRKKKEKVNELMGATEMRIKELEEEQSELVSFRKAEQGVRTVEAILYTRQIEDANSELARLEEAIGTQDSVRTEIEVIEGEIRMLEGDIRQRRHEKGIYEVEQAEVERDIMENVVLKGRLESLVEERRCAEQRKENAKEIADVLQRTIKKKEDELRRIYLVVENAKKKELEKRGAVQGIELERDSLLRKKKGIQSRVSASVLEEEITNKKVALAETRREIEKLLSTDDKADERREQELLSLREEKDALARKHASILEERKESWRTEIKMEGLLQNTKEELERSEKNIAISRDIFHGLRSIERIVAEKKMEGVYGPLYTLFETDELYWTAVEAVCEKSLFSIVVDTEETASELIHALKMCDGGRVTFIPINRVGGRRCDVDATETAFPLLSKLSYRRELESVFLHFFSDVFLVPDVVLGATFAQKSKVTAVTLDGDVSREKGSLSGGYTKRGGRLLVHCVRLVQWKEKARRAAEQLERARGRIRECNEMLSSLETEQKTVEQKYSSLRAFSLDEGETKEVSAHRKRLFILELEKEAAVLKRNVALVKQEGSGGRFTEKDGRRIDALEKKVVAARREHEMAAEERVGLEIRRNEMANELEHSLKKRFGAVKREFEGGTGDEEVEVDLKRVCVFLENMEKTAHEISERLLLLKGEIHLMETRLHASAEGLEEKRRGLDEREAEVERHFFKRAVLVKRAEELSRRMRETGFVDEEERAQYANINDKKLLGMLYDFKKETESHGTVNKAAAEQYAAFVKQRDSLYERKAELDRSEESIERFLGVLEQQKCETIEKTFEQVAGNFTDTWKKLVPEGRGELVVLRGEVFKETKGISGEPTGIEIRVSFHGDETKAVRQLSGGQKSLVALCLIFAIQQCDPAPFYLFDEVDANLDANHRLSVSRLLHELSRGAQFITTTFRQEMLESADLFYGVSLIEQSSTIAPIEQSLALQFVESGE